VRSPLVAGASTETAAFAGLKFALHTSGHGRPDVAKLENTGDRGLELAPTGIRTGKNSGYQAINLAVHLGATRILLLGYDMQLAARRPRALLRATRLARHHDPPPFRSSCDHFASLVTPLQALGVEVINCSRRRRCAVSRGCRSSRSSSRWGPRDRIRTSSPRSGDAHARDVDGASLGSVWRRRAQDGRARRRHQVAVRGSELSRRLRAILHRRPARAWSGSRTFTPTRPKRRTGRSSRRTRVCSWTANTESAFVTRPDSAPWINDAGYWTLLESLWVGPGRHARARQHEVPDGRRSDGRRHGHAKSSRHGSTPGRSTPQLLERIGTPKRALICLGPTATVMATDLNAQGVHAIDLGHVGMFLRKRRRGEPMWVTEADKVTA
jgi:hypothetical protein